MGNISHAHFEIAKKLLVQGRVNDLEIKPNAYRDDIIHTLRDQQRLTSFFTSPTRPIIAAMVTIMAPHRTRPFELTVSTSNFADEHIRYMIKKPDYTANSGVEPPPSLSRKDEIIMEKFSDPLEAIKTNEFWSARSICLAFRPELQLRTEKALIGVTPNRAI